MVVCPVNALEEEDDLLAPSPTTKSPKVEKDHSVFSSFSKEEETKKAKSDSFVAKKTIDPILKKPTSPRPCIEKKKPLSEKRALGKKQRMVLKNNSQKPFSPIVMKTGKNRLKDLKEKRIENTLKKVNEARQQKNYVEKDEKPFVDPMEVQALAELKKMQVEIRESFLEKEFIFFSDPQKPRVINDAFATHIPITFQLVLNPRVFNDIGFSLEDTYRERAQKFFKLSLNVSNSDHIDYPVFTETKFINLYVKKLLIKQCSMLAYKFYINDAYAFKPLEDKGAYYSYLAQRYADASVCLEYAYVNSFEESEKDQIKKKLRDAYEALVVNVHDYRSALGNANLTPPFVDYQKAYDFLKNTL